MNTPNKVYGIDLGTTYSAISFINEDGKPELIDNSEGSQLTASVVYFESAQNTVVGETAKEQGMLDSDKVVELIKREMGSDWSREFHGVTYTPESIAACILRAIVKGASLSGHTVQDVVITCPAYFGDKERQATRAAGEIAGLNVLQIVEEPVAAAISYDIYGKGGRRNVIVYDLGGGTFDVTIVRIEEGAITVLCSDGNHQLGGADWDICLENLLAAKFMEQCPGAGNPQDDADSRYSLHLQTEKVKKKLSTRQETNIAVLHNGEKARITVTRAEFEEATHHLLQETLDFTDKVIELARTEKGVYTISDFLLVGGSSFMPQVMEALTTRYAESLGVIPRLYEPNQAVTKGAALFGFIKGIQVRMEETGQSASELVSDDIALPEEKVEKLVNTQVKTVASKSYGIRVLKDGNPLIYNLIRRQTPVPCEASQIFPISEANASTLPLIVFADDADCEQAELDLGTIAGSSEMSLTPGLPALAPIRVTFSLSEEGKLTLTAHDLTNNEELVAEFMPEGALSQTEIERMGNIVGNLTIN